MRTVIIYGYNDDSKDRFLMNLKKKEGEYRFYDLEKSDNNIYFLQDWVLISKKYNQISNFINKKNLCILSYYLWKIPIEYRINAELFLFD